jgi:23S rRNA (cytosine1962-C5)-methyltransferase
MATLVPEWRDYELIDSGSAKKFERFGEFTLVRPEPQAKWDQLLAKERWASADAEFLKLKRDKPGAWKFRKPIPARWVIRRRGLKFWVQPAPSGHVGVFPDQACHWDWISQVVRESARPMKILSLFGHTGLATLAAAAASAEVTHVDASRRAVELARDNQKLSGMTKKPIRWIVEDALTFVRREIRRGSQYDGLMLDPPRFGRGPKGEVWRLEESLPDLLRACGKLMSERPVFVLLNVYTTIVRRIGKERQSMRFYVDEMLKGRRAEISTGALALGNTPGWQIPASVWVRAVFANPSARPGGPQDEPPM